MKLKLSYDKRIIALHILIWFFILIIPLFLLNPSGIENNNFTIRLYYNIFLYAIIYYISYLWIIPRYFFRKKKIIYFLATGFIIIVSCFIMWFINGVLFRPEIMNLAEKGFRNSDGLMKQLPPPPQIEILHLFNNFFTSVLFCGLALVSGILYKKGKDEKEKNERTETENSNLDYELTLLKNKVNPHFFFNVLNNIYVLIDIDKEEAQSMIIQLSKTMRYLLYEPGEKEAELKDDIDFYKNYINLMKLRINDNVKLEISFPEDTQELHVPPLLFLAFIENTFKFGISSKEDSFIVINMIIKGSKIFFTTKNKLFPNINIDRNKEGHGINDTKKRLNFLFPNQFILKAEKNENEYIVELEIEMNKKNLQA